MNDWYDYGLSENSRYFSTTDQINWHMDFFKKANKQAIDENTESIDRNTEAIQEQTQTQSQDAQLMRTNQTTLFGNLIKTIKGLFSKDKDSSVTGETFYEMVQRENNETQAYLDKYDKNSKSIADNTKVIGDNTKSINDSLNEIINKLETIKVQDVNNADKISSAISNLKLVVNIP